MKAGLVHKLELFEREMWGKEGNKSNNSDDCEFNDLSLKTINRFRG